MGASVIGSAGLDELVATALEVPAGNFAEVGVYKGGSAARLADVARQQGRTLYLFDTFSGIPFADEDDVHKVGDFGDVFVEQVRAEIPDAVFCVGEFPSTLVDTGPLALVHVDCDQYRSVRDSIVAFAPRMVPGGVMVFDDYGPLPGAKRAVDELMGDRVQMTATGKAKVVF